MHKLLKLGCITVLASTLSAAKSKPHGWLEKANADPKTASRVNPYESNAAAIQAGEKLYQRYCSACHGKQAEGIGRNPSLHSPTLAKASPGALYWLLRNGSLGKGMPTWSHLPPEQRWQLVSWMKSLR